MIRPRSDKARRPGAVTPLAAILLIPMLAMLALTIDVGYIAQATMELQNAADAAALAAAEQLPSYYVQYYSPGSNQYSSSTVTTAKAQAASFAKNYASFHRAGGVANVVLDTTNDFVLGYQDSTTAFTTTVPTNTFPNTVQLTLRLDGGKNTNPQLGLFFAPALGMSSLTITAKARATIYNGDLSSFSGAEPALLPATLDREVWQQFLLTGKGSLPDFNYTAPTSSAPGTVPSPAVANAPQILVVPDPNGRPGGWNYLSLNSSSNSNADFKSWFSSGMSATDLASLKSGGQLPLPSQPSNVDNATYFWKGAPGDRGDSEPFPAAGTVRILPLFKHVPIDQAGTDNSGNANYVADLKDSGPWNNNPGVGQNAWFDIVQFVGVVITDTSNGLSIQAAAVTDPNAVLNNVQAAGKPSSGDQLKTTFVAPKLTY